MQSDRIQPSTPPSPLYSTPCPYPLASIVKNDFILRGHPLGSLLFIKWQGTPEQTKEQAD
jgi:hypothetical protein